MTRGFITSVGAVGSVALMFAGEAPAAPTAAFTAAPASPVVVGQEVTFTSNSLTDPGASITNIDWNLDGDGEFKILGTPETATTASTPYESESCVNVCGAQPKPPAHTCHRADVAAASGTFAA